VASDGDAAPIVSASGTHGSAFQRVPTNASAAITIVTATTITTARVRRALALLVSTFGGTPPSWSLGVDRARRIP
jgi:hypothetical protein